MLHKKDNKYLILFDVLYLYFNENRKLEIENRNKCHLILNYLLFIRMEN